MQVVNHQHARLLQRFEVREDLLDDRSAVEHRRGGDPLHDADGIGKRVDHREPEALCVPLSALDRDLSHLILQAGCLDPRAQQYRLTAPGRRAHQHHPALLRRRQTLEQGVPLDHSVRCTRRPRNHPPILHLSQRRR